VPFMRAQLLRCTTSSSPPRPPVAPCVWPSSSPSSQLRTKTFQRATAPRAQVYVHAAYTASVDSRWGRGDGDGGGGDVQIRPGRREAGTATASSYPSLLGAVSWLSRRYQAGIHALTHARTSAAFFRTESRAGRRSRGFAVVPRLLARG
jgi:hypothetical protein